MNESIVKQFRKQKKLTQSELSVLAGVSRPTIVRVEGGAGMSLSTAKKLCGAIGCNMSDLVRQVHQPNKTEQV